MIADSIFKTVSPVHMELTTITCLGFAFMYDRNQHTDDQSSVVIDTRRFFRNKKQVDVLINLELTKRTRPELYVYAVDAYISTPLRPIPTALTH